MTTDLFALTPDAPPAPAPPSVGAWSYSRAGVLDQCARRYALQYYVPRAYRTDPRAAEVRARKRLVNRHLLVGDLLHKTARFHLGALREGTADPGPRTARWALRRFDEAVVRSRRLGPALADPALDGPPQLLEVYYDLPDAPALLDEARRKLRDAIVALCDDEAFAHFREGALRPTAHVEGRFRGDVGGVPVVANPDLLYFDEAPDGQVRAHIVDWKTSAYGNAGDSLQLAAYAAVVAPRWGLTPDRVTVHFALLTSGTVDSFPLSDDHLRSARALLRQSYDRLQALHPLGLLRDEAAFSPCEQPRVCALCPFCDVCDFGRSLAPDSV